MSKQPLTRLDASAIARTYMAEAQAGGRRLTYTQALAKIAKERGYTNVHEMQAGYIVIPELTRPHQARLIPELRAVFQPQIRIDDETHNAPGDRQFDAAAAALSLSATAFRKLDAEIRRESGRDLDILAERCRLAGRHGHSGPFYVWVGEDDWNAFLQALAITDLAALTDDALAKLGAGNPDVTIAKFHAIVVDISTADLNTEIGYMYGDAANYKTNSRVVVEGRLSSRDLARLLEKLEDGKDFIPGQIDLPDLQDSFEGIDSYWDPDLDHPWHELIGVRYTDKEPTGGSPSVKTLANLISKVVWDDNYQPEFAALMHERYKAKDLCQIAIDGPVQENLARVTISYRGLEDTMMLDFSEIQSLLQEGLSSVFDLFAVNCGEMWSDLLGAAVEDENPVKLDQTDVTATIIKTAFNWS